MATGNVQRAHEHQRDGVVPDWLPLQLTRSWPVHDMLINYAQNNMQYRAICHGMTWDDANKWASGNSRD